ncbi:MAG: polysaccharide biosynthesis protein PslG [Thermoleophilaceae bacterium]|nr:polysaccharide biosynthesis protein PslG [Thermoleophilaceae bacterium]
MLAANSRRRLRRPLLAVSVLACLLAFLVPGRASAATNGLSYGVNLGSVMRLAPAERDRHLAAITATGIEAARADAAWVTGEPVQVDPVSGTHSYDWSTFDTLAGSLAMHRLRWLPILDYSTGWSSSIAGDLFSPPTRDSDFAAYADAFAARYGRGGSFWATHPEIPSLPVEQYEIWNEPNAALFWHPQSDAPERYVDLYLLARDSIHRVDPAATVVTGGLLEAAAETSPRAFLRRMVDHRPDAVDRIDAVGYHPYLFTAGADLRAIERVRGTMADIGLARTPLAITEVGQTRAAVSDRTRAAIIGGLARRLPGTGLRVTNFVPYAWMTATGEGQPNDYGIAGWDATLDPAGAAFVRVVRSDARPATAAGNATATLEPQGPRMDVNAPPDLKGGWHKRSRAGCRRKRARWSPRCALRLH